jgi:hypothetical protein
VRFGCPVVVLCIRITARPTPMTEQTYKVVKQLGILVELVEKACEGCGFTGLAESDERIVIGLEHGF